jgi:hypothetical protein
MIQHRRSRHTAAFVAVGALAATIGLGANQAGASLAADCRYPMDTDELLVDTGSSGKVDLGNDPHWFGTPVNSAKFVWSDNNGGPRLCMEGRFYCDSWDRGSASLRLEYWFGGELEDTYTKNITSSGGLVSSKLPAYFHGVDKVVIRLSRGGTQVYSTTLRNGD